MDELIETRKPKNIIAYMHLYKCGGTTFNWILQKAFPGEVLYCENLKKDNTLISKAQLDDYLLKTKTEPKALSSHLIQYNALERFEAVVITLREPSSRIRSGFNFDSLDGNFSGSFDEYIECYRNFMVESLGVNLLADLDCGRIFTCILEQNDLSLVCLEHLMAEKGVAGLDLACGHRLNEALIPGQGPFKQVKSLSAVQLARIREINRLDYQLYERQCKALIEYAAGIPDIDVRMAEYQNRCQMASKAIQNITSYGQNPEHFVYI
jgi:hypothetical protein